MHIFNVLMISIVLTFLFEYVNKNLSTSIYLFFILKYLFILYISVFLSWSSTFPTLQEEKDSRYIPVATCLERSTCWLSTELGLMSAVNVSFCWATRAQPVWRQPPSFRSLFTTSCWRKCLKWIVCNYCMPASTWNSVVIKQLL